MVVKFERSMKKINKKLKRTRRVKAIVAAALIAPAIAVLLASKIVGCFDIIPTNELHTIVASKWRKATETLKQENMAMTSMERGVMLALKEVGEISRLVSKLETVERSIQVAAEFAIKKKSPLVASMEGMEKERKDCSQHSLTYGKRPESAMILRSLVVMWLERRSWSFSLMDRRKAREIADSVNKRTVFDRVEYYLQCIIEWSQRSKEYPICLHLFVLRDPARTIHILAALMNTS